MPLKPPPQFADDVVPPRQIDHSNMPLPPAPDARTDAGAPRILGGQRMEARIGLAGPEVRQRSLANALRMHKTFSGSGDI